MPYISEHKTRRTLIPRECEWGVGRKHRKSEHEILENNYGRDCRKEIKTGTKGEGEKERKKRDTQIAGDGEILSKTEDINKRRRGKKELCIQNVNIHYGTEKETDEETYVKVDSVYCMEKEQLGRRMPRTDNNGKLLVNVQGHQSEFSTLPMRSFVTQTLVSPQITFHTCSEPTMDIVQHSLHQKLPK